MKPLDPEWEPLWKPEDTSGTSIRKQWGSMAGFVSMGGMPGSELRTLGTAQAEQMRKDTVLVIALCELADRHPREINAILLKWYRPEDA